MHSPEYVCLGKLLWNSICTENDADAGKVRLHSSAMEQPGFFMTSLLLNEKFTRQQLM